MHNYTGGARLPVVSEELIKELESAFTVPDVKPGADRDILMYQAGQRYVVDWVKQHASRNASSGDPAMLNRADVRMGQ
jgi:hypothetical protein